MRLHACTGSEGEAGRCVCVVVWWCWWDALTAEDALLAGGDALLQLLQALAVLSLLVDLRRPGCRDWCLGFRVQGVGMQRQPLQPLAVPRLVQVLHGLGCWGLGDRVWSFCFFL